MVGMALGRFKVSKPGCEVRTAPPEGLQFNSEWAGLGYFTTDTIDCNWSDTNYRYFSFGRTFASPPPSILPEERATRVGNFSGYLEWHFNQPRNRLDGIEHNDHAVWVVVQAGGIRLRSALLNQSGSEVPVPNFRLRYWIFDCNL